MQTRTEVLTGALNAITARVDGRFDDPDLAQFGPLQESIHGDCREIARIALQKAAALPMPSTTVSQAMEFESAAALLTSKGFTWQGEQWQIPRWNRVASAADTGAAVEIGRRLPALPPILDDYEAASSAMRRANRLAKHLYFLPHLCFLVFTPLGIYLNIKASNSDGIDFIAGITLFLGLAGLVGSLSPNQEGPLDELNAAQFQELSRIASENYLVAEWLAAAFDAGKTLRLRDLEAAQHHNSNLWRIRQDVKHRTELEVARADLSKTAHEHSTLAQET